MRTVSFASWRASVDTVAMMRVGTLILGLLAVTPAAAQTSAVLPIPQRLVATGAGLAIGADAFAIVPRGDRGARQAADLLASFMRASARSRVIVRERGSGSIAFVRQPGHPSEG